MPARPARPIRRPSLSVAISLLALVIASAGSGYAAAKLPRGSVGPAQLKANAVTGAKVRNGSLTAADISPRGLPRGPVGPAGPAGRSALTSLRPGESIQGTWSVRQGSNTFGLTSVTFPVPAPAPVDSNHVVGDDGVTGDGCDGTATAPAAARGFVCLYVNPDQNTGGYILNGVGGLGGPTSSQFATGDGTRYGFHVVTSSGAPHATTGVWIYTAP